MLFPTLIFLQKRKIKKRKEIFQACLRRLSLVALFANIISNLNNPQLFKRTVICYVLPLTLCRCPKKCDGAGRGWGWLMREREGRLRRSELDLWGKVFLVWGVKVSNLQCSAMKEFWFQVHWKYSTKPFRRKIEGWVYWTCSRILIQGSEPMANHFKFCRYF